MARRKEPQNCIKNANFNDFRPRPQGNSGSQVYSIVHVGFQLVSRGELWISRLQLFTLFENIFLKLPETFGVLAGVSAVLLAVQNRPDYFLPAASRRRTRTRQCSSFEQHTAGKRLASRFLFFLFLFPSPFQRCRRFWLPISSLEPQSERNWIWIGIGLFVVLCWV